MDIVESIMNIVAEKLNKDILSQIKICCKKDGWKLE